MSSAVFHLPDILKCLCSKQCWPRSNCSSRSCLIKVHGHYLYAEISLWCKQLDAAGFDRQYFYMRCFIAGEGLMVPPHPAPRVNLPVLLKVRAKFPTLKHTKIRTRGPEGPSTLTWEWLFIKVIGKHSSPKVQLLIRPYKEKFPFILLTKLTGCRTSIFLHPGWYQFWPPGAFRSSLDAWQMLHTKYQGSRSSDFRQKDFYVFPKHM